MIDIRYTDITEDDGTYVCSALILKLFGYALVIAVGRKK